MDVRDVVRIKKGVGGLEPPSNIGILLDREKEGKDHVAFVFTVKGRLRIKWSSLKESTGSVYEGDKSDESAMSDFLGSVIKRLEAKNMLKLDPQVILDTLKPHDLWNSVISYLAEANKPIAEDSPAFTPAEIARIHYDPLSLDPRQLSSVERVVSECDDPREPYFKRMDIERRTVYVPYTAEATSAIEAHSRQLESLKNLYVEWKEEETEDGRTVSFPVARSDDISSIMVEGEMVRDLEIICLWGYAFLETGRWIVKDTQSQTLEGRTAPTVGLAGTSVWRIRKFDMERFLNYFFKDLPQSRSDDLASNIILTLLRLKRISWRTASDLVIRYKIASGAQKFHRVFPDRVIERSDRLPDQVIPSDLIGRSDLRDIEAYTIDPPDALDFDDAVSVVSDGDGWKVYVHIADVTHYVRPDDPIDSEARFRATSVYLPSGVLPMLPPKLSENLCSLKEGVDRLAVTAEICMDGEFKVGSYAFHQSVIRVRRNLTYGEAEGYIKKGSEPFATLHRISQALKARGRRLDLQMPERRVRFEDDYKITAELKRATIATTMIEELMVLANERASEFLESRAFLTAFRVHPIPDREGMDRFNAACKVLGVDIHLKGEWAATPTSPMGGPGGGGEDSMIQALLSGGKLSMGSFFEMAEEFGTEGVTTNVQAVDNARMDKALDAMNEALGEVHGLSEEWMRDLLSASLLRSMPRAFYSTVNIGHFGLRSLSYCHYTSPIRRYADDLVHRGIKAVLSLEGKGPSVSWEVPSVEEVTLLTESINDMSDSAESWERQMVDAAQATRLAMGDRDAVFTGRITSITPAACYVTFDNGLTEGRLPLKAMSRFRLMSDPDGSRVYLSLEENMDRDIDTHLLKELSKAGGEMVVFRLGDRVHFSIHSVSIAEGRIELALRRNGAESIIP